MGDEFDYILEAAKKNGLVFGVRQTTKVAGKIGKAAVFLAADARDETEKLLKIAGLTPKRLAKDRHEIAKLLELGFLSEVFCININEKDLKSKK